MRGLVIAALALGSLLPVACGDGEEQRQAREVVVRGSAVKALENYAFTTELEVSFAEGHLRASFDAAFQAPDRIQGSLILSGEWSDSLPRDMEIIVVGDDAWWREPGGDWQAYVAPEDMVGPFVLFGTYATPRFYLRALEFESLVLPLDDSLQKVNGVEAFAVRLDKPALIDLLAQGTGVRRYLGDEPEQISPFIQENAEQVLPEDFLLEAWIAEDGGYPARLVISYSCDEVCALSFGFQAPLMLRLQMEITDPDADVEIEPPTT